MMPRMIVAIAAQRNQKSAIGAITLLTAGFSASGIFGIEGVCTKLKYQSRPIHITPAVICSQRMANSHQPWSPSATRPPAAMRMRSSTISTTTPAVIVFPSDWKNAAIVFSFWYERASEKSLAPSGGGGQQAARRGGEDHELRGRERRLQPVALGDERRQQPRVAGGRDQGEQRYRAEVQHIPEAQEPEPGPALRGAGRGDEPAHRHVPVARQLREGHNGRHGAGNVDQKCQRRDGKSRLRRGAGISDLRYRRRA